MLIEWIVTAIALLLLLKGAWVVACPAQVCRVLVHCAEWSDSTMRIVGVLEAGVGVAFLLLALRA